MKKLIFITIFVFVIFSFALAQEGIVVCTQKPCSLDDFKTTIRNFLGKAVTIAYWIAFLVVMIGALMIMFGGPKPDWIKKGHSMIVTAIWAYIVILLSGIIFDFILDFFAPQFKQTSYFGPKIVLAQTTTFTPETFYKLLREPLESSLKCGQGAEEFMGSKALGQIVKCIEEIAKALTRVALIVLAFAIIASAGYVIFAPLFGFKYISSAYKILIWSTIGFIIILLAEVIRAQIEKLIP
jgi:hypothetical protein